MRLSPKLLTFGVALGIVAMPALASAQQAAAPAGPNRTGDPKNALAIGSMAPDFELPGSTRYGPLANPIHLSDFKGKTVVLAFFPKARTRGCTIQMRSYRDDYENLFDAGRDVVLIGISTDTVEEQWTWARDEQFPSFYVLENEDGIVGSVALDVMGDDAILRALAVGPECRGAGYGWMLADMAVSQARWRGVRRIYLLTESASDFFAAKFGFRVVDRSTLSKQVAASETFTAPRGSNLVAMRLDL